MTPLEYCMVGTKGSRRCSDGGAGAQCRRHDVATVLRITVFF